jgi:TnpA family transposase
LYLADADRALVVRRREDHSRLGLALQLGTVRFLGTFLTDPTDVPPGVVTYMSRQLRMADPSCVPRYLDRRVTRHEHAQDIQRRDGYRDFHAPREVFRLVRWLYTRAWLSAERPSVLFDLATARLVEHNV